MKKHHAYARLFFKSHFFAKIASCRDFRQKNHANHAYIFSLQKTEKSRFLTIWKNEMKS